MDDFPNKHNNNNIVARDKGVYTQHNGKITIVIVQLDRFDNQYNQISNMCLVLSHICIRI